MNVFANIKNALLVVAFLFIGAVLAGKLATTVNAYSAGEQVTVTGTFVESSMAEYTHELQDMSFYFILGDSYDAYNNQTVDVVVTYTDDSNFAINSIELSEGSEMGSDSSTETSTEETATTETTAPTSGETVSIEGVFTESTNATYTHTVNGYNLILSDYYSAWVGQEVVLEVQYVDDSFNFTINSIALK